MANDSAQRIHYNAFQNELIPWAKSGALKPFLVQFPLRMPDSIQVTSRSEPLLAKPEHHPFSLNPHRWPKLGLHACRYPCLGCVLDGEVDISVGVTHEMAAQAKDLSQAPHINVLSLSRQDFFMFPPGMPCSDSSKNHPLWQRPEPEKAKSRTLWMRVLPMGVILQISRTQKLQQTMTPAVFLNDPRLLTLTEFLMTSAQRLPRTSEVVRACLLTLLLSIDQCWSLGHVLMEGDATLLRAAIRNEDKKSEAAAAVERACNYIHGDLIRYSLSLPEIAHHAYISVSQLKRLFRSELNTSVMEYVTLHRLEEAKRLLAETDLPVQEISYVCGYQQRTHFSRLFLRRVGMSPREFRRQCNGAMTNPAVKRN